MAKLQLKQISKVLGEKTILDQIDLTIEKGEFIVVVGASGCGKSTLLRMIAGLEEVTHGEISINDQIVNRLEPKERDIAMVFQNYALYPHMNIYNNMAYGLRIRKLDKKIIQQRVREAAKLLGLKPLLNRKPQQLSGGQRQRVAIGRAIVRQPAVFLFDEPLSNLDAKLRVQMRLEIKKLHRNLNATIIYVTHDQIEAMTLADRLVVLNKGRIEQIGTPLDVYRYPASKFVAGFIGSPAMNFLHAAISHDGKHILINDSITLPLITTLPTEYHGKTIILGIRPENIYEKTEQAYHFDVTIEMVESLGSQTLVHGKVNATSHAITVQLPSKWPQYNPQATTVSVAVKLDNLHLFDPKTKKRITT